MIGFIQGKVIDTNKNEVIVITSGGVGYRVNILGNQLFLIDQEVNLYTYTVVKENEISLWGFSNKSDLALFENLISVSGIGSKTAMVLLESKGAEGIIRAIMNGSPDELKVTGVGLKTAQKLIIELNNKLAKFQEEFAINNKVENESNKKVKEYFEDSLEALTSLGYREADIKEAFEKLLDEQLEQVNNSQDLIKLLLRSI
jgi:Holliday junction DNA helicase RuvA